jgi:predicted transcriptional regulator
MSRKPKSKIAGAPRIGIATPAQMKARLLAGARGKPVVRRGDPKIWATSIDTILRLLSPENRQLLAIIRNDKPESVSALVEKTNRDQGNVSRAIGRLERFGLVRLVPTRGRQKRPEVTIDKLRIELDLESGRLEIAGGES